MAKTQFVEELNPKDEVENPFLIKHIALMEGRDGRSYLNLILADATGDIESRKWLAAEEAFAEFGRGDVVLVEGKVNVYQNRKQLIVQNLRPVDMSEVIKEDYMPKSLNAPDAMFEELVHLVDQLDDVYIKELLQAIIFDHDISRRLKTWPAGKSIHHAYEAGLLEHIVSCSRLGISLSEHYQVNKNYVVAGCVLHDLCKIYEITEGPFVDYTDEGKLVGHLVKGVELLEIFSAKIKNFPYLMKIHLKHILLSHHGHLEYGSPKVPQTSEAYLCHLIDYMDSKMNALETIKKDDKNPGRWSGFVRHLDRVVYKDELPHYNEFISESPGEEKPKTKPKTPAKNRDKELTHSMADQLKNLKIDS